MNVNSVKKAVFCLVFALALSLGARQAVAGVEKVSLVYAPEEKDILSLRYDVFAGGFKALNATMEMDLDKKAYDLALVAATQGFIGSLFPWKAQYETSGHTNAAGAPIPTISTMRTTWKGGTKLTEMSYDPQGNLLKTTTQEDGKTKTSRDTNAEMAKDSVDMLTGTLQMMQAVKNTEKCEGSFPVFDGKRRFDMKLQDEGVEELKKTKYSSFRGEAIRCTLKVVPVAGFKEKDKKRGWMAVQAHTEERKKPPTIWLARTEKNGPMVPVRMEIASAYGTVVAHLTSAVQKQDKVASQH